MTKKRTATAITLAVAAIGLTGCAQIHQQVGDAWSVTYEVTVDSPDATPLHDVRYVGAETRGAAPETHTVASTSTKATSGANTTWTHESIVLAEDDASVRATPPADVTASCRVLLDGKKVLIEEHGGLGQTVRCAATTPKFG
ncbi:hypothetical protein [Curtobacterium sp. 9128]|uniref:hypothetical protein n=1 Tax=Curtobacterium sp. 9128 TaxID=1793722 RepID=UPI00119E97AD|nr:hypothetical protein [Curtobacterium sp. 9128]